MESMPAIEARVEKFLNKRLRRLTPQVPRLVAEPRSPRGIRHSRVDIVIAMLSALLRDGSAIRHVEKFSSTLGLGHRGNGISDGALTHFLTLAPVDIFKALAEQCVKDSKRRNELAPDGLAQHWSAIDGKYSTYDHHCGGLAQKFEDDGRVWWRLGTLRAVLVSSRGRTMLGFRAMPPAQPKATASAEDKLKHTGETTNLLPFVEELRTAFGDLCDNFTVDAGLWSKDLFLEFDRRGLGLFAGLKANRGDLYVEAVRLLNIARTKLKPMAESQWEPCGEGKIRRRLWRTDKLDGSMGWTHLRQVILVEQTTENADGKVVHVEDRYFVTNATVGMLTPAQGLTLVRRHWAIENDGNWTFDMQFGEDDGAWCTQNFAPLVLAHLRMIAYNIMQHLRKSHVAVAPGPKAKAKGRQPQPRPWVELTDHLHIALRRCAGDLRQWLRDAATQLLPRPLAAPA